MKPGIFKTTASLNVYEEKSGRLELGTQALHGRYLKVISGVRTTIDAFEVIEVQLCEDGYKGWLKFGKYLDDVLGPGKFTANRRFDRAAISKAIPDVLAFLFEAMQIPNRYLWGGTIGPNFDCSGLVQTAFASQGIWLPRDAEEQHSDSCVKLVKDDEAEPGDLLFFSRSTKIDHVGVHLGNRFYIHSSGLELGRGRIGIDRLSKNARGPGANYFPIYRDTRRVCSSVTPKIHS